MNESIKKRIEAVRRGEVPDGYRVENGYLIPKDWKIVPLNKRFTRSTRKNKSGCENVLTISAQMGLVNQREFYDKDIASDDKSGYFLMKKGEFAYNKSYSTGYPYGAIKQLTKYDEGIVSPLYICFAPKAGTNTVFYTQYFECGRYNREIYRVAQEGARNHGLLNVAVEDFFEGTLVEPSAGEQQKIAEILTTCDRVIELKQCKIDELNKLKQTYLRKMFPQKGKTVPEIRFPDFSDPWGQRKLGDLVDVCSGRDYKHLSEGDIPVYGTGGYMLSVSEALSYDKDAIGIGRKGTIDKPYILNAPFWTVDTLFYAIPREKIDLNFAFDIFQNIDWKKKDESTGVPSLSKTAINEIDVLVPQYDEQQALGEFFNGIDNLITLHQRELEEYGKYKKALMQLLLTGLVRVYA